MRYFFHVGSDHAGDDGSSARVAEGGTKSLLSLARFEARGQAHLVRRRWTADGLLSQKLKVLRYARAVFA